MIKVLDYYKKMHPGMMGDLALFGLQEEHSKTYNMLAGMSFDESDPAAKALGDHFSKSMENDQFSGQLDAALARNAQQDGSNPLASKIQNLFGNKDGVPALDAALTSIDRGADLEKTVNQTYGTVFGSAQPSPVVASAPNSSHPAVAPVHPAGAANGQPQGQAAPPQNTSADPSAASPDGSATPQAGTSQADPNAPPRQATPQEEIKDLKGTFANIMKLFGELFKALGKEPMFAPLLGVLGKFGEGTKNALGDFWDNLNDPHAHVGPFEKAFGAIFRATSSALRSVFSDGTTVDPSKIDKTVVAGDHPTDAVTANAFRTTALVHSVNDNEIKVVDAIKTANGKDPAVEHEKAPDGSYIMTLHMPGGAATEYWGQIGLQTDPATGVTSMDYVRLNSDKKTLYVGDDKQPQFFITKAGNLGTNQDLASYANMVQHQDIQAMLDATGKQADASIANMRSYAQDHGFSGDTLNVNLGGYSGGNATMAELQSKLYQANIRPDQISEVNPVGAGLGLRLVANGSEDGVKLLLRNVTSFRPRTTGDGTFFEQAAGMTYDNAAPGKVYEYGGVTSTDSGSLPGNIIVNHNSSTLGNVFQQLGSQGATENPTKEFTSGQFIANQNTKVASADQDTANQDVSIFKMEQKFVGGPAATDSVARNQTFDPTAMGNYTAQAGNYRRMSPSTASGAPSPDTTSAPAAGSPQLVTLSHDDAGVVSPTTSSAPMGVSTAAPPPKPKTNNAGARVGAG